MPTVLKNKWLWSVIILTVLLVFFGDYVASNWRAFLSLELKNPYLLVLLAAGSLLALFAHGALLDVVLRPLGLRLRYLETFGLAAVTRLANQLTPGKLGFAVRASYLKRRHEFAVNKFAAALGAAHILMYLFSCLIGLGALLMVIGPVIGPNAIIAGGVLAGFSLVLLALLLFSPRMKEGTNIFSRYTSKIVNGWFIIRSDDHIVRLASTWSITHTLGVVAVTYASFNALGADISVLQAVFISSFVILAGLLGITPSGLGISEGLIVAAASVVGIGVPTALAAALVRRMVSFGVLLAITPILSHQLFHTSFFGMIKQQRT